MRVLAAVSPDNVILVNDDGGLVSWLEGMPQRPAPWSLGVERLLEVGRAKYGLRPVVNEAGDEQPEMDGDGFPTLVLEERDGREVYVLQRSGPGHDVPVAPTDNADEDDPAEAARLRAEVLAEVLSEDDIEAMLAEED